MQKHASSTAVDIITIAKDDIEDILQTLRSVHAQTYENIRHIIVLPHPEDATRRAIETFAAKKTIIIVYQDGLGIENSLNCGIRASRGDIMAFLNSGDSYTDADVVSKVVATFQKQKWAWAIGDTIALSRRRFIKVLRKFDPSFTPKRFWNGQPACHQSMFYAADLIREVGFYDESISLCSDYDFNCRCLKQAMPYILGFSVAYYDTTGGSSRKVVQLARNLRQVRNQHFELSGLERFWSDLTLTIDIVRRFAILPLKLYL